MKKITLFLFLSAVCFSCSHKAEHVERAFYYWKSDSWGLSGGEDSLLKKAGVRKLYVKFFEVEHHGVMGNVPISKTSLHIARTDSVKMNVVPVVYIQNDVFKKSSTKDLDILADNVNFLIGKYAKRLTNDSINEYQMDCDWTKTTKANYFYFLNALKRISKKELSCTLRLYPYKYPEVMGIPPVDRATLMCYNLINPLENKNANSILDKNELENYLENGKKYPLHLDIALPVYSWMQVYQNNKFVKILRTESRNFKYTLRKIDALWHEATEDIVVNDFFIRRGDRIKYESVTAATIEDVIGTIKRNVELDGSITVSLFHLDDAQLKSYTHEEIGRFYSDFTR